MTQPKNLTGRIKCTFKRKHALTSKLLLVVQVEERGNDKGNYWRDATIDDFSTAMLSKIPGFKTVFQAGDKDA